MRHRVFIASLVVLLISCAELDAQRGRRVRWVEPIPSWGIESSIRVSLLKDDPVSYVGARVGRQFDASFNAGVGGSMMLTNSAESFTSDGFERVTSLVYIGPSIELRDSLRGPVRFLLRTTALAGLVGFDESSAGSTRSGTSFMYGFEPEVGINVRAARQLQVNATVGGLFAWRVDGGR